MEGFSKFFENNKEEIWKKAKQMKCPDREELWELVEKTNDYIKQIENLRENILKLEIKI